MPEVNDRPIETLYVPAASVNAVHNPMIYYRRGTGYKRSDGDPQTLVLPYKGHVARGRITRIPVAASSQTYAIGCNSCGHIGSLYANPFGGPFAHASNKAWEKLMGNLKGDTSALAVAAAEGRETFEMVAKRVTGLYRSYRNLRKGDFLGFLRELRVEPKRKHSTRVRSAAHEASGLWLEYWFGWSPTVQDLYSGALALSSEPVLSRVREIASSRSDLPPHSWGGASGRARWNATTSGKCFVKQGATFEVENSNLFLANRLGLVNPALIAWELVPFSFVVDWFTSFGTYLEGFTDLAGLRVTDAFSTCRVTTRGETRTYSTRDRPRTELIMSIANDGHVRRKGLTRPMPVTPKLLNFGTSKTRAATAVSLLTAIFIAK